MTADDQVALPRWSIRRGDDDVRSFDSRFETRVERPRQVARARLPVRGDDIVPKDAHAAAVGKGPRVVGIELDLRVLVLVRNYVGE